MAKTFKIGDHVSWNSEAGRVRGTIVKVHTRAVNYKSHIHRATADEPQYEIKSDKTDRIALHRGPCSGTCADRSCGFENALTTRAVSARVCSGLKDTSGLSLPSFR